MATNKTSVFKFGLVSLIGQTNVGKSTLLNRIVGEKISIISPKVQTTRTSIRGIKTTNSAQIVFLDTPGFFHKPRTRMDQKLTQNAREGLLSVDLVLFLVIPQEARSDENMSILADIKATGSPSFLVINKIDTVRKERLLPLIEAFAQENVFQEIYPISALNGENVDRLEQGIVNQLPSGSPHYDPDVISTANLRFIGAEIIREKVYDLTNQEIPYASAVQILDFTESDTLVRIEAIIYVEKESQKGIIIGKKGEVIKRIGIKARQDIQTLLDTKVFLDLRVKVRNKWRSDEHFLEQLGL